MNAKLRIGWAVLTATVALFATLALLSGPATASPDGGIPSPAAPDHTSAITRAVAYLHSQQRPDGGLPGFASGSDPFATAKGVIALAAVNLPQDTLAIAPTGTTMLDYLAGAAFTYTRDLSGKLFPNRAGLLTVAAVAGEADPKTFGGVDLVAAMRSAYHPPTGAYSTTASLGFATGEASAVNQAWTVLGLAAAQESVPLTATHFLLELQEDDGGWGYGAGGDVDTTALALQALLATGHVSPEADEVQAGLDFLQAEQDRAGGWGFEWGGSYAPSADATASALQAVVAAGYTPATKSWAAPEGDPHAALAGMQAADGSFSGNALGTAHAIAGLAEAPLPLFGREQRGRLGLAWLAQLQGADGAWPTPFGYPAGATADAVLAFAAAGYDPATVRAAAGSPSAMEYLSGTAAAYAAVGPDAAGKLALAVSAAGGDPTTFGGTDLVAAISAYYSPTVEAFAGDPGNSWHQSLAILGLRAAGEPLPEGTLQTLRDLQQPDGGWKYDLNPWSPESDPDSTGLAMQALVAAGAPPTATSLVSATAYLRAERDAEGGWSSANSTALAIQGLLAAGADLGAPAWQVGGRGPLAALEGYQKPDGAFAYGLYDSAFATRQAVPALLGRSYPLSGTLAPWAPVMTGPDPDRLVLGRPRYDGATGSVVMPFGSDLNANGAVTVNWRLHETVVLVGSAGMARGAGHFTAALPFSLTDRYVLSFTALDPDGVQGEAGEVQIHAVYLPLVRREAPSLY